MANIPKTFDNASVARFLADYWSASDLIDSIPQTDDILSGVLGLKTSGDTSTRSLSRSTLFVVLQNCDTIDVRSIDEVTLGRYGERTLQAYAALGRVASKALAALIQRLPATARTGGLKKAQQRLDDVHRHELEAAGLC